MGKVTTIKGDLFNAPKGSIIIHACNTQGAWGAGIAKDFAKRFPKARDLYSWYCKEYGPSLLGTCLLLPAGDHTIGCLFTSKSFGRFVDKPDRILASTKLAITDLIRQYVLKKPLHTCKINSGMFGVPWSDTKDILKESEADFVVYDF